MKIVEQLPQMASISCALMKSGRVYKEPPTTNLWFAGDLVAPGTLQDREFCLVNLNTGRILLRRDVDGGRRFVEVLAEVHITQTEQS